MKKALFLLVFISVLLSCSKDNELSSLLPASQSVVEHSQGLNALQSKILELDLEYNNYNKRSILNYWS